MSCKPSYDSDPLSPEEVAIFMAYLHVPEVREHYIGQRLVKGDGRLTLSLIGALTGYSKQRINQIEQEAMRKLRKAVRKQLFTKNRKNKS